MADEKLGSFKAGELQRKQPAAGAKKPVKPKGEATTAPGEPTTLGFARIEEILDTQTREQTHQKLAALTDALDALVDEQGRQAKLTKLRAAAEKAKVAVGHTRALLEYLFDTKDSLASGGPDA